MVVEDLEEDADYMEMMDYLGPTTPDDVDEPLTEQAANDIITELGAEQDMWERNTKLIDDDVLHFLDNPSIPSGKERMAMLEKLEGNNRFYDKWLDERTAAASEYSDYAKMRGAGDMELMDLSKAKVKNMMGSLEELDEKAQVVEDINEAGGVTNWSSERGMGMDFGLKGTKYDTFNFQEQGMELQRVSLPTELESLEMPYYAIDAQGEVFSAARLAGGDYPGLEAVGWDILPSSLAEIGDFAFGAAAGVVGGFAIEGLIQGFTPIMTRVG